MQASIWIKGLPLLFSLAFSLGLAVHIISSEKSDRLETALALLAAGTAVWALLDALRRMRLENSKALEAVRDIAERKEAEAELKKSRDHLNAILGRINEAVVVQDAKGRIVFANHAAARTMGLPSGETVTAAPPEVLVAGFELFQEDGSPLPHDLLPGRRIFLGQEPKPVVARSHLHRTGEDMWLRITANAVLGADGALQYVVNTSYDMTELKTASDALRQRELELRHSQKMEAVGRLAGGVAHDFNNLLMTIMGYSEYVLGMVGESHPLRAPLEQVRKAGERASSLTSQLLAYSRKQVIAPKVVSLNTVAADMDRMLRRLIGEDIDFALTLDPALGLIRADTGQLEQILLNLVVNARDAMPQGGRIAVSTRNVEVTGRLRGSHSRLKPGSYALLEVADTGAGMDEETLSHIFEPFFTTKEKGKGTGLGLSTLYGIVQQSSGAVAVESGIGRGSVFRVYFPIVGTDPSLLAGARSSVHLRSSDLAKETVLLVEDEESVRVLVQDILQRHGYRVFQAANGTEALNIARNSQEPIHLLLTDVVMAQMSGRRLAEELLPSRPDLKVLYMSGYTDDAVVRAGVYQASVDFIQKPFKSATLVNKMREVLERIP